MAVFRKYFLIMVIYSYSTLMGSYYSWNLSFFTCVLNMIFYQGTSQLLSYISVFCPSADFQTVVFLTLSCPVPRHFLNIKTNLIKERLSFNLDFKIQIVKTDLSFQEASQLTRNISIYWSSVDLLFYNI